MGEGALRGFTPSELIVADRRGLFWNGEVFIVGLTAELGGGLGGEAERGLLSKCGLTKVVLLKESLRRRLVPRSFCASGRAVAVGGTCENRFENVALARRAWTAAGITCSVSSSRTGEVPNVRLNGNVPVEGALVVGDWARK
jgi:hypothetical protein